ncbi:putative Ca(2) cation antiporter (CaCA) (TC 2.A.19) family protein [Lyophyllum shimeji]|uniref:Ca(2) cation antiporter (CaCA) (TC 2.A.19) family protein n=1 Tax=Lyophyllum shimeji TaxID=47721 RepID=A0A9P3UM47_LYOSH|nr:putative Ca(2) cation antiporter (CaCA) (TC 2.A.19) family protein [Lyophyllum shimeji]
MSTHIPSPLSDDNDSVNLSSTPTPVSHLHRAVSHGSQWSARDAPQHHHQGTSYYGGTSPSSSPNTRSPLPPILIRNPSAQSTNRLHRSDSRTSSHATGRSHRDELLGEEDEEGDDEEDEDDTGSVRPSLARRGKTTSAVESAAEDGEVEEGEIDPITLKERQSLINVQHPFGLPIWKPALYKKSRSVTRYADQALHAVPSAQAERHLLPGNIFWAFAFGWWLAAVCMIIAGVLYIIPQGGKRYSSFVYGLGWYLFWPFGKYVEGDIDATQSVHDEGEDDHSDHERQPSNGSDRSTVRAASPPPQPDQNGSSSTDHDAPADERPTSSSSSHSPQHSQNSSSSPRQTDEHTSLLRRHGRSILTAPSKSYGTTDLSPTSSSGSIGMAKMTGSDLLGKVCFWLAIITIIAPLMLIVCLICWALVVTIPMAKLNWQLLKHLFAHPTSIRFCAAPPSIVMTSHEDQPAQTAEGAAAEDEEAAQGPQFAVKHPRLAEGQQAPSGSPSSKVLLCTYRAVGLQYFKYTVGGVNILFVNLLPVVFFVILDGMLLLPMRDRLERQGKHVPALLAFVASRGMIFVLSLLSVIPLSYFIGMAVASISAQSSIGMGAVINATFGSLIEIILYCFALTEGKGRLVEGSIIGSLLAGVLLMPGMSMCSAAVRRKEHKFNARSAGVTSMMLIMAIIGALAPTLFYQTYGNFQLVCTGCPKSPNGPGDATWTCDHCYYRHPDPATDPFYQSTVKSFMFLCAAVLVFSYLVGLWFSLRTHASQIWQNPQSLMHPTMDMQHPSRTSLYQRLIPSSHPPSTHPPTAAHTAHRKPSNIHATPVPADVPRQYPTQDGLGHPERTHSVSPSQQRHTTDHTVKDAMPVPENMMNDEFSRAVAAATVTALRHQQAHAHHGVKSRLSATDDMAGEHTAGHDAPSWSRTLSASVLLACTALYAVIAELLVHVVDVVLDDSGVDEKFLGITLFALVPNTTEFMNAMSFALNNNIALSMEIGSAYALQVCLLQIPAMVAFSAWYSPETMGERGNTFTLIFPRWDVISIILSMFLMTYTWIEAKSNYHRGSILIMSYLVLVAGFFFAPPPADESDGDDANLMSSAAHTFSLTLWEYARWYFASLWR